MPKLKKSDNESSCAPRSDSLCRCLASMPSNTSHNPANRIHTMAKLKSASIANLIELKPKLRPVNVITFGRRTLKSSFFIYY